MLETRYYKDMNRNYLIVKCQEEPAGNKYPLKMITDNKIPGLLGCSIRYINGETYLYYEINSLQTLKSLFEYKKVKRMQAVRILSGLKSTIQEIQKYLLADSGLLLAPEYMFTDWESDEIYFVYYPFDRNTEEGYAQKNNRFQEGEYPREENSIRSLLEFLVEVIDHQDEQLVDMIYGLYQLAESGRFVVDDVDYYLENKLLWDRDTARQADNIIDSDKKIRTNMDERFNRQERGCDKEDNDDITEKGCMPDEELIQVPSLEKKQKKKFLIMAFTAVAGAMIILYIRKHYLLTPQEELLSWILLFTFLFILLITGLLYILLRFSVCSEKKPAQSKYQRNPTKEEEKSYITSAVQETADLKYGDTVFLFSTEEIKENKLYGISKGNKHHIDLSKLPCTIGKMQGCTDYCISDSSISRLHAKFTGNENAVYLTDLNSTNGTYKNGLRLQPSETVQIEAGDEIRLGKLTFCYR